MASLLMAHAIRGRFLVTALAATGQETAAPPTRVMNSRRFMSLPPMPRMAARPWQILAVRNGKSRLSCLLWSIASLRHCDCYFRSNPTSRHYRGSPACLKRANRRHGYCDRHRAIVARFDRSKAAFRTFGSTRRVGPMAERSETTTAYEGLSGRVDECSPHGWRKPWGLLRRPSRRYAFRTPGKTPVASCFRFGRS
jgi:hypothetical protein